MKDFRVKFCRQLQTNVWVTSGDIPMYSLSYIFYFILFFYFFYFFQFQFVVNLTNQGYLHGSTISHDFVDSCSA
jgi:hypothetical protein